MTEPAILSEAIVWWTGWGQTSRPRRKDDEVAERYGEDTALDLIPATKLLETDFYSSDARHRAPAWRRWKTAPPRTSESSIQKYLRRS
jgi:hypothetical protein